MLIQFLITLNMLNFNVNSVLNAHDQFLETCLRECHLSNKFIFKIIHKLMVQVTQYVNYMNQIHRQVTSLGLQSNGLQEIHS